MEELKNCPFCGTSPRLSEMAIEDDDGNVDYTFYAVHCDNCGASLQPADERAVAIAAWNRRAEPTAPDRAAEAVREERERRADLRARLEALERKYQSLREWAKNVDARTADYTDAIVEHDRRLEALERTVSEYAVDRGRIEELEVRANEEEE